MLGSPAQFDPEVLGVRDLTLELDNTTLDLPLASLFPSLKRLFTYPKSLQGSTAIAPDFCGLHLEQLRMGLRAADSAFLSLIQGQMTFSDIRHICLYGEGFEWPSHLAVLDGMTGAIDVRVHGFAHWSEMVVFFPDVQHRRSTWFYIFWEPEGDYHPLQSLPGLASRCVRSLGCRTVTACAKDPSA